MASINWQIRRNLETSLVYFLKSQTTTDTIFYKGAEQTLDIRVGNAPQESWTLPNISVYVDSQIAPRGFIGNNRRLKTYLMIMDIRALDDGMRADLAEYMSILTNEGFSVYTFTPNPLNVEVPSKTLYGKASVEFISDTAIRSENANLFEKFRHRISFNITIAV